MRKHNVLAPLLALFVLVFAVSAAYSQEVSTAIGVGVSGASTMQVSNTDITVQGNLQLTFGKFLSLHTAQYDSGDKTSAGHDDARR